MSYQVFARKYRPSTFADVLGQDHVVRTLRNAIAQNRLAHAYLFVGPRGTGKTSTARIFAKALNCTGGPSIEFDPADDICREIAEGRCLDVLEIDGASNNGVEQVRELRESVKFAPARCRFKIYYIDEVHMLSTAAFNALLKTLEEPPEHVKFIFATTEANKILPTIISRCQRFDLRRIPLTVIAKHLLHIAGLEGVKLDEKAAFAIGKGAEGGMRDAQSMLDQLVAFCGDHIQEQDVLDIFGFTAVETVARLSQHILESDTVGALRLVHEQSEAGKDLSRLLSDLIQHVRTVLVHQTDPESAAEDLEPEVAQMVAGQAQMAATEQLLRIVDGLAEVDARMRWASNKRLHFELGVIQAVQHLNEVSLSAVIEALDGGATPANRPPVRPQPTVTARRAPAPAPVEKLGLPEAPARTVTPKPPPVEQEQPPPSAVLRAAPEPLPARAPVVVPPSPAPAAEIDAANLWQQICALVQERRPLASTWANLGTAMEFARGVLKIGFPTTEHHAKDSLMRDSQRKFLEGTAAELAGVPVKIDMVLDPSLKPPPATELHFNLDEPAPAPKPTPVDKPTTGTAPSANPEPAPVSDPQDNFHNDPLIKSAIEQFKLKLADSN